MNNSPEKIAVLMGGPGSERRISMASGEGVLAALQELGYEAEAVDVRSHDWQPHPGAPYDLYFNLIHGTFGEDGKVQGVLDRAGLRYTGENAEHSRIAFDKILSKKKFEREQVPTPAFEICNSDSHPGLPLPYVVKAPREGSSVGIFIVKDAAAAETALKEVRDFADEFLVEEFVHGRELTVGVLGDLALPVIEIRPKEGFYNFENKYPFLGGKGGADHFCPAALSDEQTQKVQQLALRAHRALGLETYSRVDVLLDEQNDRASVLEINTIPGMTESSLLPEAAGVAGISYPELCQRIIDLSLARYT